MLRYFCLTINLIFYLGGRALRLTKQFETIFLIVETVYIIKKKFKVNLKIKNNVHFMIDRILFVISHVFYLLVLNNMLPIKMSCELN